MSNRATTNLASAGSDSDAGISTDMDDPANLNFGEPEEDQANEEVLQDQGSDVEPGQTTQGDGQEPVIPADGNAEGEKTAEGEEPAGEASLDDTLITLKGGDQVPFKELKSGYMRDRDYRVKTQEVATKRRELDEMSNRVANTAQAFASFLANQLPEEPTRALAMQNPMEFTRQKAIYDEALGRIHQIIEMGNAPKEVAGKLTEQQQNDLLAAEDAKLAEVFPQTATDKGRQQFFDNAFETGRDLGFSDKEMQDFTDHRYLKVIHYARLGLAAEQAKARALTKVNNAPPPAVKPKASGPGAQHTRNNQDAMQRLSKTGSMKDALSIDFE